MFLALVFFGVPVRAAGQAEKVQDDALDDGKASEVLQWLVDKVKTGELDIGDEASVREAIAEGERKFAISLDEKEKERIVKVLEKVDSLGLDAEELLGHAEDLYQKYGTEMLQEANHAINEAVEEVVENAAKSFWENLKISVQNFFKNLFHR